MSNHGTDHPSVVAPPPLIYGLGLALGGIAQWAAPWPIAAHNLDLLGLTGIVLGMALSLWAVATTSRAKTSLDPNRATTALVTTGPFGFSRNPVYLAMTISCLGLALFVNSIWLGLGLTLSVVVVRFGVIVPEEHYLQRKFGTSYLAYRSRVRRWL